MRPFVALLLGLVALAAQAGDVAGITAARFVDATDRYPHAVLGDDLEWGGLEVTLDGGARITFRLPDTAVFEDLAPRLVDLDNDGRPEVIVVLSHQQNGAQLAIYDETGKVAATPPIGTRFRWLAPIGAGDLDGDGLIELAYIDRPHLAKTLRVWRYQDGVLTQVASLPGLSNHRIGEDFISGGLRDCGDGPEMVTANADWSAIVATRYGAGVLSTRILDVFPDRDGFAAALACRA